MTVTILRWVAGAGGDTVIRLCQDHDQNIISDFDYTGAISAEGATPNQKSQKILSAFPELMGLDHLDSYVDYELALERIQSLAAKSQRFLFKTHCYRSGFTLFRDYTVDITTEPEDYPFIVQALITKNWPNGVRCPINYTVNTQDEHLAASYYTMTQRQILARPYYNPRQLPFRHILAGFDQLKTTLRLLGFDISNRAYYDQWRSQQEQYFPSDRYRQYILDQDYNWQDTQLSRVERYCLMALSTTNFRLI